MTDRSKIMIVGANGALGRMLLHALGPEKAVAATRADHSPLSGFDHVRLTDDGAPPSRSLVCCKAVINAAGSVGDNAETLDRANVQLPRTIAIAAASAGVGKMVQVSSFSVFGDAENIDAATAERPLNAYGRSKANGDRELQELVNPDFGIESVRLPFMFSASKPNLLLPLLKLTDKLGLLPAVKGRPIYRSMITYADAASTLIKCASDNRSGNSLAADPMFFDYSLLVRLIKEEAGRKVGLVSLPQTLANTTEFLLPGFGRRLFRSSLLDPRANRAGDQALGLESELRELIRHHYRS